MIDLHEVSSEELDRFAKQVCQASQFLSRWCDGGIRYVAGIPAEVHEWKLPYTNTHIKSVIDLVDYTYILYVWEEDAPADAQYVQWVLGEKNKLKFIYCTNDVSMIMQGLRCLDVVKPLRYNELEAIPVYGLDYVNSFSKRGDSKHDWHHQ